MVNVPPDVSVALSVFTALVAAGRTSDEPKLHEDASAILGEYLSRAAAELRQPAIDPVVSHASRTR